jgi:hypothetical protein
MLRKSPRAKRASKKSAPKPKVQAMSTLPEQLAGDIQLFETDTNLLMKLEQASDLQSELRAEKLEFLKKVDELAGQHGLSAKLRVYFTFEKLGE